MNLYQWVLAALTFISEIGLWVGVGRMVWLWVRPSYPALAWILAALSVGLVLLLWVLFFAPKAEHRLAQLPRVALIVAMTLLTGLGLYRLGDKTFGLLLLAATLFLAAGQILLEDLS